MREFFKLQDNFVPLAMPNDRAVDWGESCKGFVKPFLKDDAGNELAAEALDPLWLLPVSELAPRCAATDEDVQESDVYDTLDSLLRFAVQAVVWHMRLSGAA